MTNVIFKSIPDRNYNDKILSKESQLKLDDFNDVSKDKDLYFRTEKTTIASYLYYGNEGEKNYLSYEVFESKYKWPIKYNFNKRIKCMSELGARYVEKECNLPKDIKVYMTEKGYEYIIISENIMVKIATMGNVSEEELINIVYEKIFK